MKPELLDDLVSPLTVKIMDAASGWVGFQITVPGIPTAKGRPRFARRGKFVRTFTPAATEQAEMTFAGIVAQAALQVPAQIRERLRTEPLHVEFRFTLPRPQSAPKKRKWPFKKPDLDNLEKLALDALNRSGIWGDDAQVVVKNSCKVYGEEPSTWISIRPI